MAYTMIVITVSCLFLFNLMNCQIQEPREYAATAIPQDTSLARQVLGYNKYDGRTVQNSDKAVLYGNNWERYEDPNQQSQYQNQYYQNDQAYRYY